MDKKLVTVVRHSQLNEDTFDLYLKGEVAFSAPGQFVNLAIDGVYLRRPISVCDWWDDTLRLVYRVVGKGTKILSTYEIGRSIDVLTPLGNGFDTAENRPSVMYGGGVGTPPMLGLAKTLREKGVDCRAVLGFNSQKDIILYEDFVEVLGKDRVAVTTVDGSFGQKGFVTDIPFKEEFFYACGPEPMLKALCALPSEGLLSFESRMGCGFGGCMGCSCKTKYGYKRICKEGPVLKKEEIIW